MNGSQFSIRDAITYGWVKAVEHIWLFIKIALTFLGVEFVLLLGYLPILLIFYITGNSSLILIPYGLFVAYSIVVGFFLFSMAYLGLPRILLDLYEQNKSSVSRLFGAYHLILPYIGASLLLGVMLFAPLLLMAVLFYLNISIVIVAPLLLIVYVLNLYITLRFSFFNYVLIDKRETAIGSLQDSWNMTEGTVTKLILFYVVLSAMFMVLIILFMLNVFGFINALHAQWYTLAFISALFLAVSAFLVALAFPMFMLAQTYVYKKLSLRSEHQTRE